VAQHRDLVRGLLQGFLDLDQPPIRVRVIGVYTDLDLGEDGAEAGEADDVLIVA